MNLRSIYHININCTNFDRSYAFYQMLGFRPIVGPGPGGGGVISERVLHLGSHTRSHGVIMSLATILIAAMWT